MAQEQEVTTHIAIFEQKTIRRQWYKETWYYSIIDVINSIVETENANRYWSDLKRKLFKEGYDQVYEKIVRLKMLAPDGKLRLTDAADTPTLLRMIQSIPSPRVEPLKRWLAQVGTERLEEMENPELAVERWRNDYRRLGYPEDWIDKRIQSILVRNELTNEWDMRGSEKRHYGILTAEIAKATFGVTPKQHQAFKGLQKENLRDHMTPMELVLTMLGEVTTTELHRERDSQGVPQLQRDPNEGGAVAGRARRDIEAQLGMPVVSPNNYLPPKGKSSEQANQPSLPLNTEEPSEPDESRFRANPE